MADFDTVKGYIQELRLSVTHEEPAAGILVVQDMERGINSLVIDCEDPIVIFEQVIMPVPVHPGALYCRLLQMNRTLVHGAFALDEPSTLVLFRSTLPLANLDLHEVEGVIDALSLALIEHAEELIALSQHSVRSV